MVKTNLGEFQMNWLFFDIGSTLVDESNVYKVLIHEVCQSSNSGYKEIYSMIVDAYKQNHNGFNFVVDKLCVAKPKWKSQFEILYDDAKATLQQLKKQYKIGIIANQTLGCEDRLKQLGIAKYIDLLVYSEKEGYSKPDLRLFEIALQRSGCKASDCYMIGDRIDNDIIPAKQLGMKTIWIRQGFGKYWTIQDESERADFVVDSLYEIIDLVK